jgi:glucosamine--fructose-6-phosphate aminotransferase (isomerizing)
VGTDRGDAGADGDLVTSDRVAALLEDVLGEPTMLAGLLDAYGATGGPLSELLGLERQVRVVFAGLGSSRYGALDAAVQLRAAGVPAWVEFASADAATPPSPDTVLVAISASGKTPETVAVAERHRGISLVVAVTNQPESRLAASSDVVLPLYAGVETSGVSSRTFLATITVMHLLNDRLRGRAADVAALRPVVEGLDTVLERRGTWLATTAELFDGAGAIGVIGPASSQGLAEQAALLFREGPRLHASAHDAVDWFHSAIYTALPGYRALLLPGTPDPGRLADAIAGRGGATVAVEAADGRPVELPTSSVLLPADVPPRFVTPAVADVLAAELWSRASGKTP